MYNVYQVRYDDTMDSIASAFGITKDELAMLNNINNLTYGDFIVVPNSSNDFFKYEIKKGDNLYGIASKYGTTIENLISLNGLNKNDYIYPGEVLLIPKSKIGRYEVKEGDTLNKILALTSIEDILDNNSNIYLLPNQVILYTKE